MKKHLTEGEWIPDIQHSFGSITASVYTKKNLNMITNLGHWANQTHDEGIANAVLIANAKRMFEMLRHVDKYGYPNWVAEDLEHLLAHMDLEFHKLRSKNHEDNDSD